MPKRSKIATLPVEVRKYLDRTLIEGNFAGYEALAADLTARGYVIGKSSVHRYGEKLERKLAAMKASTEAALMLQDAAPDDQDALSGAVIGMVQTDIFNTLVNVTEAADSDADPEKRLKLMSAAAKNIATLTRASVTRKRWAIEIRDKARTAADAVAKIAAKGGLTKEAVNEIRSKILGVVV